MMMLLISILLATSILIYLSFNRFTVLLSAPIVTLLIMLMNKFEIQAGLFAEEGSYLANLGDFLTNYFLIFILGSIMAKLMSESGAINRIAEALLERLDHNNPYHALVGVFIVTALLTYGGISLFVVMFAVVPFARRLFDSMQVPWHLATIPIILGLGTFTASMLPGSPSIINVIPTQVLHTNLMASPLIGIISAVVAIFVSLIYMKAISPKVQQINTHMQERQEVKGPSLFFSLLPLFFLIVFIFVGTTSNMIQVLESALVAVILVELIIYRKYLRNPFDLLNMGAQEALIPLLSTGSTVAFGQYVSGIPAINQWVRQLLQRSPVKLMMASLMVMIFTLITGSSSGAIAIIIKTQGELLLELGLNPEVVHRVLAIASTIFPNTPHSGVVLALLSLMRLPPRGTMLHVFLAPTVVGIAAWAVAFLLI